MSGVGIVGIAGELFKATKDGQLREELSGLVARGRITHNVDAAYKLVMEVELRQPTALTPFTDFLAPRLTLRYADGRVTVAPLGVYAILPPKLSHRPRWSQGGFTCYDLTALLDRSSFPDGYAVAAGVDPGAAARAVVLGAGFDPARVAILDVGKALPAGILWEPGTTRLDVANDLLGGAAHYALWTTLAGIVTTRPLTEDFARIAPAATYTKAGGAAVVPPLDEEPDLTRLCNVVVVRKTTPDQPTLYAKAVNDNPASPTGVQRIGELSRPPVDDPQLVDQAAAQSKANALLAIGASYYRKLTVRTLPDPVFDAHQVVALDLAGAGGAPLAAGKWWRQGAELGFTTKDAVMTHHLARVEAYGVAS